jgi:gliding motility-associated-like protein
MLFLFIGLLCSSVQAQPYWAKDLSGLGNNHIADVQVDADGSIYVTGEYGGTAQLDGQSLVTSGSIDLFVARMDPDGTVLWLKRGGGPGIDRGVKLALGGTTVAITGEFLGTATFEGETITSAGGTSDMYVAVLDKDDGALQWLRQGGGAAGTDRPSGISVAADGSLCVTGEFRGSATWGTITQVSLNDPTTGTPSTDVFITRYSAAGDVLWVRTGSARFADRGVDVVHNAAGGIYVTGQFSDTIAFQQVHPNALLNATFLVHFDASGDEQWFRRAGGAGFNHVRDLGMAPDGNLLMVGDVQGTMVYFGPPQVSVPGGDPYAYYLLEVSGTGQLIAQRTVGSSSGLTARGLALAGNDIAVLGEFTCQFTDLRDLYGGSGLFMAVGPQDLFVSRHSRSGLVLNEAQQFGGRSAKSAGGIAFVEAGQLVFTGSFQQNLIFPATAGFDADLGTGGSGVLGNSAALYCDDPDYGTFAALTATALLDGFVARGYVEGREPYDWWLRTGSACERDTLDICIRRESAGVCEDTIRSCGPTGLNVLTEFSHTAGSGTNYLGPPLTYAWSNGSAAPNITVSSSGTYWVTVTSENGCYLWRDTIRVIVVPVPPLPLVSDDVVLNTATSNPQLIELCDPETHWVWSTNVPAGNEHYWVLPDGTEVPGDSIQVDTTGNYTFVVVNAEGCQRQTVVPVLDSASPELPDLGLDLLITFPEDTDLNDSLLICPGLPVAYEYTPQWTVNGVPVSELPPGLEMSWGLSLPPGTPGDGGPAGGSLPIMGPGWYVVDLWVRVSNLPCGEDSVLFNAVDSIHVQVHPLRDITVDLVGPQALCDGESVVVSAICTGCDTLIWSPGNVQLIAPDSILVSSQGSYQVVAQTMDSNGCLFSAQASIILNTPSGPTLQVDPADGIICPGGEATLSTTTVGTGHVWYGPEGPIEGEGGDLTTTVPGEYYLTMQVGGCSVTSNNVELFSYGTPFLDVQPFGVLCRPGDEVVIQVLAAPGADVQWSSPLNGSALQQVIDEAGTYACTVTSCGITTPLSVDIISAPVEASLLTPGPFTLCSGDSVVLEGEVAGTAQYWLPGYLPGSQITVGSSGTYAYVVANEEGCRDTTLAVVVEVIGFEEPLLISGDTTCAGSLVTLVAQGSGTPVWYADAGLTQVLATGAQYQFTASVSTILYTVQQESGCVGDTVEVGIVVRALPVPITISGPGSVCLGEPFLLSASAPDSVALLWSTPAGTVTGSTVQVGSASGSDQGQYSCTPTLNGCVGATASLFVQVNAPIPIELPEFNLICEGAAVELSLPNDFQQVQWSTGSTAYEITVAYSDTVTVMALDANGCSAQATAIVVVEPCDLVIPNVFTPNSDGVNDGWRLSGGFVGADAWIYSRWGTLVHEGEMAKSQWDGTNQRSGDDCPEGVYYYVLQLLRADGQVKDLKGYVHLLR